MLFLSQNSFNCDSLHESISLSVRLSYAALALACALAFCSCILKYARRELRLTEAMSLSRWD